MEGVKKYVVALGCVITIVLCGIFIAKTLIRPRNPSMPRSVRAQTVMMIDKDTLEEVTVTRGDIETEPAQKDLYWRNPKTGAYTLARIMVCPACGKNIPMPIPPVSLTEGKAHPDTSAWEAEQKCPRCGQYIFR